MSGYSSEQAGNLEERQHTLELVQERISALESQLIAERESRKVVVKDITSIHFLRSPFSRLPQEILSLIFKAWDDNPFLRNRTPCLVCKTWYRIVWNSTSFWTEVVLRPDPLTNRFSAVCRFAELCSQRSINKPLDVVINFSAIVPYYIYIGKTLDRSPEAFSFLPPGTIPKLARDAESYEEHPDAQFPKCPYSLYYERIPQTFMRQLMDQSDDLCLRWRSLRLILPTYADVVHNILNEMAGNMGQLVKMEIRGIELDPSQQAGGVRSHPRLPRLQSLTTTEAVSFNHMSIDYARMNHLRLLNHYSSRHFLQVAKSHFSALFTLELLIRTEYQQPFDPVLLPRLISLTLKGAVSVVERYVSLIDAPILERLHLEQPHPGPVFAMTAPFYKTVKSMLIEGYGFSNKRYRGRRLIDVSYEALSTILRNTPALVSLRIKEDDWGTATETLAVIQAIRDEGYPLSFLKEVISVDESSDFLTEDMSYLSIMHVLFGDITVSKETK